MPLISQVMLSYLAKTVTLLVCSACCYLFALLLVQVLCVSTVVISSITLQAACTAQLTQLTYYTLHYSMHAQHSLQNAGARYMSSTQYMFSRV
jgi:hypothetical protein